MMGFKKKKSSAEIWMYVIYFEYYIEYGHMDGSHAHMDIKYSIFPPSKFSHSFLMYCKS